MFAGLLIQIEERVWHDPETGSYVSHCDPLDVCSQGDTEKEAIANLNEAVQIFLSTCYEMGTLNDVLKECGLTPLSKYNNENVNGGTNMIRPVILQNSSDGANALAEAAETRRIAEVF